MERSRALVSIVALVLGLVMGADSALADDLTPVEPGKRWMVTTTSGATYFGALAPGAAGELALIVTTKSGEQISVLQRDITKTWNDEAASTASADQIVGLGCAAIGRPRRLVREFVVSGQAPFLAEVADVQGGRYIRVQRLPRIRTQIEELAWSELEQIKPKAGLRDECVVVAAQASDSETPPQAQATRTSNNPNFAGGVALVTVGGLGVVVGVGALLYGAIDTAAAMAGPAVLGGPSGNSSSATPAFVGGALSFLVGAALVGGGIVYLVKGRNIARAATK